jgi:hypothetical protein
MAAQQWVPVSLLFLNPNLTAEDVKKVQAMHRDGYDNLKQRYDEGLARCKTDAERAQWMAVCQPVLVQQMALMMLFQ